MLINDLSAKINANRLAIDTAIKNVLDSGWLVLGPQVKEFETEFAKYVGVRNCVSEANGTDALELALRTVGVVARDKVANVANAGMYTTTALLAIGAKPVFMDVDVNSNNTTLVEVEKAIALGVKAVVVTHLYGLAVTEIVSIAELCARSGVKLVEDCAQAHGAFIAGKRVGCFGDIASFSFYPTKNLGALGDGGAVVTNNDAMATKLVKLRQYGWSSKYTVGERGGCNSRLDEMQAAILKEFLPLLDNNNTARRSICTQYSQFITHPLITLPEVRDNQYVGHIYVIKCKGRNALRQYLKDNNIASDIHYPIPDHRQPVFGDQFTDIQLPNTESLATEILTLPCYPEMSAEQVNTVIKVINAWQV